MSIVLAVTGAMFIPDLLRFIQRGVPDLRFTGDGAILELGTWLAARGRQMLGPYSQFHWNHPGPLYFYLSAPLYELLGERGTALNLFALMSNAAAAVGIVFSARSLAGHLFAFYAAALLAVFGMVALPFLLTNEWNPIITILPFALLTLLSARLSLGAGHVLPLWVFVASSVVQTHIAFVPSVLALAAFVLWQTRLTTRLPVRRVVAALPFVVAVLCWILPILEFFRSRTNYVSALFTYFFANSRPIQTWTVAFTLFAERLADIPIALLRLTRLSFGEVGPLAHQVIAIVEIAIAAVVVIPRTSGASRSARVLSGLALSQFIVAVVAIRAIRGDVQNYQVAWVSALGLLVPLLVGLAFLRSLERSTAGRVGIIAACAVILFGAVSEPVARSPIYRARDLRAERAISRVETYLAANSARRPFIRIESDEAWPLAAGVVLALTKHHLDVAVDDRWLFMFGPTFASTGLRDVVVTIGSANAQTEPAARRLPLWAEGGVVITAELK